MKILWLTWKDGNHPHAGGAETVNEELAKRLARDGHEVLFVVGGFPGCEAEETRDGFRIVRLGGRYSVYWHAYRYYVKNLRGWADLVIEEINTMPFFSRLYAGEKRIYLFYQLCREIWFYQMVFPINILGYLAEPLYLGLLSHDADSLQILTESESAKKDLVRHGFDGKKVSVFPVATHIEPVENLDEIVKYDSPTMLSLGAVREMKRTDHQVRAFETAKRRMPDLRMKIAGDASSVYGKKVLRMIAASEYKDDIEYLGKVSGEQKIELMRKSHVICVSSVKEGWGLIVTEANSQGTPAVVYDVDGLRDSVRNEKTGIICAENTPKGLAEAIISLLAEPGKYAKIRRNAWEWSREFDFEKSYLTIWNIIKESL